jgi:hypothetical protein
MSKEQKRYLNWISRDLFNALEAIKRASNTYLEMNAKNLIDYQEASAIDHYIERAMLPVQDALEYVDSLIDEPDNGGEG